MTEADRERAGSDRSAGFISRLAWDRRFAAGVLVLAGLMMFGILLFVGRWLLFWQDEWDFVFGRQTLTARSILSPHVDALLAVPSLVYQVLIAIFGLRAYLPFLLVDWAAHFVCVALLYTVVARRSGVPLGLAAALSLLFLGSAFEDLLQPFQMLYLFAAAGGLLAIERLTVASGTTRTKHRFRDLAISEIALLFAIASSSLGPIFVGLVIVWGVLGRDRGATIVAITAALIYAAWYVAWGQEIQHLPGGLDPFHAVATLLYGLGAAVSGIVGLPPLRFAPFGLAIGAAAAILVAIGMRRGLAVPPLAGASFLALVAEYGLQTIFRGSFGIEHAARSGYLYPAAIFIWLTLAAFVGHRLSDGRWRTQSSGALVPVVLALLIVPMVIGNMRQFVGAARATRDLRATELAELQLIEAIRDVPGLALDISPDATLIPQVTARRYLAALDRFGAPALGWDWHVAVDGRAVDAAALRLLGPAIRLDLRPGSTRVTPDLEVSGATTATSSEPGCASVRPSGGHATAKLPAGGRIIWMTGLMAGRSTVLVGVVGQPSAILDGPPRDALLDGRPIALPDLPDAYRWRIEVRSDAGAPFEICTASIR